ncbi:hypothetical protein M9Y10_034913 [Tritrichomonas musculus]|uniref:HTH psq-type domain-containing protein n=1 Tax=Tritrichomonas musculus TaxID=1915356 RepID=A0ABR2KG84_9EUKA
MGRRKKKFGIPHRRYFLYPDLVSTIQQEFNQLRNDEWTDERRILTNLKNKYGVPRKTLYNWTRRWKDDPLYDPYDTIRNTDEVVLNPDETGFQILPTSIRSWAFKNTKNFSINVGDSDKDRVSIMAIITSDFNILPLFIIAKAEDEAEE